MKKCLNCGTEARDEAKFCTSCGTPFAVEAVESAVAETQDVVEAQVEKISSYGDDIATQAEVISEQVDGVAEQAESAVEHVEAEAVHQAQEFVADVVPEAPAYEPAAPVVPVAPAYEPAAPVVPEAPAYEPTAPAPPAVGFAAAQVQGMKERLAADQTQSMYEYAAPPAQQPQPQYPQPQYPQPQYTQPQQAQGQQLHRPAEPPPHGYGYPQHGGQPQTPGAPGQQGYGYGSQSHQPPVQQQGVQAPPTYGYPPQAPQQPAQHMRAQQPHVPQQPAPGYGYPPQGAYAPPTPPAAPKKKRRWVIPVIIIAVVVALLVGAYFVFGDQIKGLFGSKANAYQKAEREVTRFDDHRLLGPIKSTLNKQANETKFGGKTSISLEIKGEGAGQIASVLDIVNKLRLTTEYKVEFGEEKARFQTKIGLGNREKAEDAIGVTMFNIDNGGYVIDATPILQKPLVLTKEAIDNMLNSGIGSMNPMALDMMGQLPNVFRSMQRAIGLFSGETADHISDGIYKIIFKYAEQEEKLKDQELKVGSISQKFDQYNVVVKAEKVPEMLKEMLAFLRDDQEVKKLITELLEPIKKLQISSDIDEMDYNKFVENINKLIEEIDEDPDSFKFGVKRTLYVDSKNKPQGGVLIITKPAEPGEKEQSFTIEHAHVEANGQHAFRFFAQPAGLNGIEFTSMYTVKDNLYTGSFEFNSYDLFDSNPTTMIKGDMSDFGLEADGDLLYPVGELSLTPGAKETSDVAMLKGLNVTYSGKLESKDDGKHLIASVVVNIPVEESGPSKITISIDHRGFAAKDIKLDGVLPSDYIDLSDADALKTMFENDPGIMTRLFQALADLGIDLGSLAPTFD